MMAFTRFVRPAMAALAMVMATGAVAQKAAPPAPAAAPAAKPDQPATLTLNDGYVLGTGDIVEVAVLGREEFHPRVQVQTDGTIQLPLLHSVKAADLTVLQLRDSVRDLLKTGGYYTDPVVSVVVATFASRYVTVLGEVAQPGLLPVDRAYRISEILARVGGARATGDDEVQLRRANGDEMKLQVSDIASGGPDKDPFVNPGDKIFIAAAQVFYIYGQVSSPGSFRIERGMTYRMALARGGGLTARGSEKRIKVFRGGQQIKKIDLSGKVQGGDTIVIGERFF